MRKNPSNSVLLIDDIYILAVLFPLYFTAYILRYHSICLTTMLFIDLVVFHIGLLYGEKYYSTLKSDEDDSDSSDETTNEMPYSYINKEYDEYTKNYVNSLIEKYILKNPSDDETYNIARTPSSTYIVEDGEIEKEMPGLIPAESLDRDHMTNDRDDEYGDMPGLIPLTSDNLPSLIPLNSTAGEVYENTIRHRYSKTHYLNAYADTTD